MQLPNKTNASEKLLWQVKYFDKKYHFKESITGVTNRKRTYVERLDELDMMPVMASLKNPYHIFRKTNPEYWKIIYTKTASKI